MKWIVASKNLPKGSSKIGERYYLVMTLGGSFHVGQYFKAMKSKYANKEERQDRFAFYVIPGCYYQTIRDVTHWMPIAAPPETTNQ